MTAVRLLTEAGNPLWVRPNAGTAVWGETIKTPASGGLPGKDRVEASETVAVKVGIPNVGTWTVAGDVDSVARLVFGDDEATS